MKNKMAIKMLSLWVIGLMEVVFSLGLGTVFARSVPVEDNQLIEQEKKMQGNILQLEDMKFKQVNSCNKLEKVLKKYLDHASYPRYGYLRGEKQMMMDDVVMETVDSAPMMKNKSADVGGAGGAIEHSTTNNQKEWVDEPDIIKNDGQYVYYYNAKQHKIYIIKSPLFDGKLDLEKVGYETIINVPRSFWNIQLFISENKLVILSSRWNNTYRADYWGISGQQKTSIIVYDLKNKQAPKLERFNDVNGSLRDARLIGDTLYVFSESSMYRPVMPYYRNNDNEKAYNKKVEQEKKEVKDSLDSKHFLPRLLDVQLDGKLSLKLYTADCDKVSYVMPDDKTLQSRFLQPVFTTITALDVQDPSVKPELTVLLSPMDQIHVSKTSVYLTNNFYLPTQYSCGWGALEWFDCITPYFDRGRNTLIHKFAINDMKLNYVNSNVVPWDPLTQYSMDEDANGYFRILTRKGWRKGTNFYSLGDRLDLLGKIENIEPEENFKGSKYIGDKLYLVTYQQIDPLFVIDIADVKHPKIIGAMKTPWYSTYLHPLGKIKNGVQYLIGLGYGTKNKGKNRIVNAGVKLSIYKVDYNNKETVQTKCWDLQQAKDTLTLDAFEKCKKEVNPNNIAVSTVDEKVYGGQGSDSEVLRNPRLFVIDRNNRLTLPLFLQDRVKNWERCSTYIDSNGVETKRNCYPVEKTVTEFVGLKSWDLDQIAGIKEVLSVNYMELFKKMFAKDDERNHRYYNDGMWRARWSNMRVGYIGKIFFLINDFFADFTKGNEHKYLFFGEKK